MRISDWSSDVCSSDLKAPHPSPLSAHNGFFGCRHFSKANEFLKANGQEPIDWSLPPLAGPSALDAIVPPMVVDPRAPRSRSEEHTSELQSLMRISYAVFCLKNKKKSKSQNKIQ